MKIYLLLFAIFITPISASADWLRYLSGQKADFYISNGPIEFDGRLLSVTQLTAFKEKRKLAGIEHRSIMSKNYINCDEKSLSVLFLLLFEDEMATGNPIDIIKSSGEWSSAEPNTNAGVLVEVACNLPTVKEKKSQLLLENLTAKCEDLAVISYWTATSHLSSLDKRKANEAVADARKANKRRSAIEEGFIRSAQSSGHLSHGQFGPGNSEITNAREGAIISAIEIYGQCINGRLEEKQPPTSAKWWERE